MNTYSLYRHDELIASKSSRKDIMQYTGVSPSMFLKCVDGVIYKKMYRVEIDGEIHEAWEYDFAEKWEEMRKLFKRRTNEQSINTISSIRP